MSDRSTDFISAVSLRNFTARKRPPALHESFDASDLFRQMVREKYRKTIRRHWWKVRGAERVPRVADEKTSISWSAAERRCGIGDRGSGPC